MTHDLALATGALRLDALADGVVRFRHAVDGVTFAPDQSYAVDPDATWSGPTDWAVRESDEAVEVETAALRVRVHRATGALVVRQRETGEVLVEAEGLPTAGLAHAAALAPADRLYGLGDKALGLDRRGHRVEMWNTDAYKYRRGTDPLYKTVPFVLKVGDGSHVGLFYDTTRRSTFDLGRTAPDRLAVAADGGALDLTVLWAPTPLGVVEAFARRTGRTPMLPRWALGYHQSRYSYRDGGEVREVARQLRARRIPCDVLYFDIHYMDGYRVFTWHPERFPDPPGLLADLRADGFRSVVIVDPGVKADDPDYDVYRDGHARGAFVTMPDGSEVLGEVWPGTCAFPDFTAPAVRRWWGDLHAGYVAAGVDGVWNDMNEPALFSESFEEDEGAESMDVESEVGTIDEAARHALDGRGGTHAEAHNVYGMQMLRSTFEGLRRLRPDRRPFTITRASYAGGQRFGIGWTGDNSSTWDHLRLAAECCLSLGVSGMPVVGADVGGFTGESTGELLARWTQLGAVTPFFRNHSAIDAPRQEPWQFGAEVERVCREAIELRYRLLPHLYTALWQAATRGTPILRPLPLAFPADETARQSDDHTFLVGDGLLAAPVVEAGATTRSVPLPDVPGGWVELATGLVHAGGQTVSVDAPLDVLPLFLQGGSVAALGPVRQHTGEPVERLTLHIAAAPGRHTSWLYDDAGDGYAHESGGHWTGRLSLEDDGQALRLAAAVEGEHRPEWTGWDVVVHGLTEPPRSVRVGGSEAAFAWDGAVRFAMDVGAPFEIVR